MNRTPFPFTVGDQHLGPVAGTTQTAQRCSKRREIVSVTPRHFPAKDPELCFEIPQIADIPYPGVRLDLVVIHDQRELAQATAGRACQRFPNLSFLQLAVSREDEQPTCLALRSMGKRHPLCLGDPHAQRAGVGDDSRSADVGVARQTAEAPQPMDLLEGDQTEAEEDRVQAGGVVSLGGKVKVLRLQLIEVQPGDDVQAGEAAPDVPGSCLGDHVERVDAAAGRE